MRIIKGGVFASKHRLAIREVERKVQREQMVPHRAVFLRDGSALFWFECDLQLRSAAHGGNDFYLLVVGHFIK